MEEIDILPTTVYSFNSESRLHENVRKLVERETRSKNRENYATRHDLYTKKEYAECVDWLKACVDEVTQKLGYACKSMEITQMTAAIATKGQTHHPHDHSNSVISGVWYLNAVEGGETVLFDVNRWHVSPVRLDPSRPHTTDPHGSHGAFSFKFYEWYKYDANGRLTPRHDKFNPFVVATVRPEPGKLILFPAWLLHAVAPNLSRETRYTIAFNCFPRGFGYGSHKVDY